MKNAYIFDVSDIMQIMKISRNTVYQLLKYERLPFIKIGNRYKIPAKAFRTWLESRKTQLIEETEYSIIKNVISDSMNSGNDERSV